MNNIIEKYCEERGFKLAAKIDKGFNLVVKPKPKWLPEWLYKKIINECVGVIEIK